MRVLLTLGFVATLVAGVMAQGPAELKVGDMAPDFTLPGTDGKTHKLSEYRGKQAVVVAWFPRAFTQGCTIECKSLAENGDRIKKYDVTYFMASVDALEDNIKFAKATSVTLGDQGRREEGSRLPDAQRSGQAGRHGVRRAQRARHREPLDVLHRQDRSRSRPSTRWCGPRRQPKTWWPSSAKSRSR